MEFLIIITDLEMKVPKSLSNFYKWGYILKMHVFCNSVSQFTVTVLLHSPYLFFRNTKLIPLAATTSMTICGED